MKFYFILSMFFACWLSSTWQPTTIDKTTFDHFSEKGLFESDQILSITLKGNLRELLNDRADKSQYHSITLSYRGNDSAEINIPVQIKTRGHFRKLKENCKYPPLLIKFSANSVYTSSIFKEQSKLKLVMPCAAEDYVVREWLAYKIYNLVTPQSFKARLVKVKLEDTKGKRSVSPFYGLLLEEEKQMAERNKGTLTEQQNLKPQQTQQDAFLRMAVFEYLIGNTDWSVQYLQNIKLIKTSASSLPVTVPYDFDHSGIVNAPYAHPAEELLMSSVLERRYRGYCVTDLKIFEPTLALYNKLKKDIYDLFLTCTYLDAKSLKSITKFLDGFYETINDQKAWKKDFAYPCDKNGTGNVVIKGLRED
jgi:hypothetical protein